VAYISNEVFISSIFNSTNNILNRYILHSGHIVFLTDKYSQWIISHKHKCNRTRIKTTMSLTGGLATCLLVRMKRFLTGIFFLPPRPRRPPRPLVGFLLSLFSFSFIITHRFVDSDCKQVQTRKNLVSVSDLCKFMLHAIACFTFHKWTMIFSIKFLPTFLRSTICVNRINSLVNRGYR